MTILTLFVISVALLVGMWRVVADLRRGSVERGTVVIARAGDPSGFWVYIAFSLLFALACLGLLAWFAWTGAFPTVSPFPAILLIGFGAHWLAELRQGSASIGSVSFARTEEAREYWLLVASKTAFLLILIWHVIISLR